MKVMNLFLRIAAFNLLLPAARAMQASSDADEKGQDEPIELIELIDGTPIKYIPCGDVSEGLDVQELILTKCLGSGKQGAVFATRDATKVVKFLYTTNTDIDKEYRITQHAAFQHDKIGAPKAYGMVKGNWCHRHIYQLGERVRYKGMRYTTISKVCEKNTYKIRYSEEIPLQDISKLEVGDIFERKDGVEAQVKSIKYSDDETFTMMVIPDRSRGIPVPMEGTIQTFISKLTKVSRLQAPITVSDSDLSTCGGSSARLSRVLNGAIILEKASGVTLASLGCEIDYGHKRNIGMVFESEQKDTLLADIRAQIWLLLEEMHKKGIYHRDVTLYNLMIDLDENKKLKKLWLIDFGCAVESEYKKHSELYDYRVANYSLDLLSSSIKTYEEFLKAVMTPSPLFLMTHRRKK